MSGFSFGTTVGASQSEIKQRFEGNDIYTVKFLGAEIKDITGVKDPSMTYKTLLIKFGTDDNYFTHTVFEPKPDDFKRAEKPWTDPKTQEEKVIVSPSNVETMMLLFRQVIDNVNPKLGAAIDDGTKSLAVKTWDELRALIVKATDPGIGVTTKIKLIKNKKGEPQFPFFTSIGKESKAYVSNNIIGEKIFFSAKELAAIEKAKNAKPTTAASYETGFVAPAADEKASANDLDFDL